MTQFFGYTKDDYININMTLLRIILLTVILVAYRMKENTNYSNKHHLLDLQDKFFCLNGM